MSNNVQKRKYVIGLFILLAMATVSTYAWSYDTSLATKDPTTVYVTSASATDYQIGSYSVKILGTKDFKVYFTGTGLATPVVQFMFLNADGTVMAASGVTVTLHDITANTNTVLSANSDNVYTLSAISATNYYIDVNGAGCVGNLNGSGTAFVACEFVIP